MSHHYREKKRKKKKQKQHKNPNILQRSSKFPSNFDHIKQQFKLDADKEVIHA